jgi:hypothetical protein
MPKWYGLQGLIIIIILYGSLCMVVYGFSLSVWFLYGSLCLYG